MAILASAYLLLIIGACAFCVLIGLLVIIYGFQIVSTDTMLGIIYIISGIFFSLINIGGFQYWNQQLLNA